MGSVLSVFTNGHIPGCGSYDHPVELVRTPIICDAFHSLLNANNMFNLDILSLQSHYNTIELDEEQEIQRTVVTAKLKDKSSAYIVFNRKLAIFKSDNRKHFFDVINSKMIRGLPSHVDDGNPEFVLNLDANSNILIIAHIEKVISDSEESYDKFMHHQLDMKPLCGTDNMYISCHKLKSIIGEKNRKIVYYLSTNVIDSLSEQEERNMKKCSIFLKSVMLSELI